MPRTVVSYTTLPGRYDVLQKSVKSIIEQTLKPDKIYISIPEKSKRFGTVYPSLPDYIKNNCEIVKMDNDYGPLSKIYGGLYNENDENTIIITCDDDVIFNKEHIKILVEKNEKYGCAVSGTGALLGLGVNLISIVSSVEPFDVIKGFTGFPIKKHGSKCDLLFGVAGVLYKRWMFPPKDKLYEEIFKHALDYEDLFHNDDILLSGHLSKNNVDRLVFNDIPSVYHANGDGALSGNFFSMFNRSKSALKTARKLGMYKIFQPCYIDYSPLINGLFCFAVIIVFFLAIYLILTA